MKRHTSYKTISTTAPATNVPDAATNFSAGDGTCRREADGRDDSPLEVFLARIEAVLATRARDHRHGGDLLEGRAVAEEGADLQRDVPGTGKKGPGMGSG